MSLAEKLVYLRKQKGLTQMELAEKLNVSRQAISRWEVGAAIPSTDNLMVLSVLYGVPIDYLLNNDAEDCCISSKEDQVGHEEKNRKKYVFLSVIIAAITIILILVFSCIISNLGKKQITQIDNLDGLTVVDEDDFATYTFSFDN